MIGWRSCFLIEAALGVPIVLLTLLAPDVELRSSSNATPAGETNTRLAELEKPPLIISG